MRFTIRSAAAAAAAGAFVLVAGSGTVLAATPSPSTVGTSPVTMNYYSVSTQSGLYSAGGQLITDPNATPTVGDYLVGTDADYAGTQASHSNDVAATDHIFCIVTKAPGTATCSAEIAIDGSMIVADHSIQNFASNSPNTTLVVTGGTGAYQGVHGTVKITTIGNTNNSEAVVTISK
jgi:hypothetical protein